MLRSQSAALGAALGLFLAASCDDHDTRIGWQYQRSFGSGGGSALDAGSSGASGGAAAGVGGTDSGSACIPGTRRCLDTLAQLCNGDSWLDVEDCAERGLACLPATGLCACTPGSLRCGGNTPESCSEAGVWVAVAPCSGGSPRCTEGSCETVPSCEDLSPTCATDACCSTDYVPGGGFDRKQTAIYPAELSEFLLDRYEVTVARFRRFVAAYPNNRPPPGSGAHPKLGENSAWKSEWEAQLPETRAEFEQGLACDTDYATWSSAPSGNEDKPLNCVTWFEAFAFCVWDGGRLPTETEWNYAAAGGDAQRTYPWGSAEPSSNADRAVYGCFFDGDGDCTGAHNIAPVGSAAQGAGRFGQRDLVGNLAEWNLDREGLLGNPCVDCANLGDAGEPRVYSGGSFDSAIWATSIAQSSADPPTRSRSRGFRCARDVRP